MKTKWWPAKENNTQKTISLNKENRVISCVKCCSWDKEGIWAVEVIQEPVKWHSGDKSILKWNQERTEANMWARFLRILVKGENDMVILEGSTFSWYSIFMYNTNGTKRKKVVWCEKEMNYIYRNIILCMRGFKFSWKWNNTLIEKHLKYDPGEEQQRQQCEVYHS